MTPRLLWGTDPRLSFHPDGTRALACVDILPRPATLLEREKRELLYRQTNWLPEPGGVKRGRGHHGRRYPTGRSKMDDTLRWR